MRTFTAFCIFSMCFFPSKHLWSQVSFDEYANDTKTVKSPWSLSVGGTLAFPTGIYASRDVSKQEAGIANLGHAFYAEFAMQFNSYFGAFARVQQGSNPLDSKTYWSYIQGFYGAQGLTMRSININNNREQFFAIGPKLRLGITDRWEMYAYAGGGRLLSTLPQLQFQMSDSATTDYFFTHRSLRETAWIFVSGFELHYRKSNQWSFYGGVDYNSANVEYQNIPVEVYVTSGYILRTQYDYIKKLRLLHFRLGVSYHFNR